MTSTSRPNNNYKRIGGRGQSFGASHGPSSDARNYNSNSQHTYSSTYDTCGRGSQPLNSSRGYHNTRTSPPTSSPSPDTAANSVPAYASCPPQSTSEEDTVRFVAESWSEVEREMYKAMRDGSYNGPDTYREKEKLMRSCVVPDFVPLDLECWRVRRLNMSLQ